MRRPRRFFPLEYKPEVIELIRSTGKTVGQVARELDLTETTVRQWVRQAALDAGRRSDELTTAEGEELRRLRRENRELPEERESSGRPRLASGQCEDEARPVGFARFFAALAVAGGLSSDVRPRRAVRSGSLRGLIRACLVPN
jgi:transposase